MRFCISSIFLLTQCSTGLLDWFTLVSAAAASTRSTPGPIEPPTTTSTRSTPGPFKLPNYTTPRPYIYRRTLFEVLDYWSGESLKSRRNNCVDNKTTTHNHTHEKRRSGRRRNSVDTSHEDIERSRITRFSLVDSENASKTHDAVSNETVITDTRLNGYTLMRDMETLMMNLKANVSITSLAKTVEVHDIVLIKMSQKRTSKYFRALEGQPKYVEEEAPQKKIILIVHGLAAMGFRTIPCLYNRESFMKLVKMYTKHLDKFDIFLMPMANPDGIADETIRIWNKNKAPETTCSGVAVDRNFDVQFPKKHNISPCSQYYPGPAAFSEPESRAVADLIHHYSHKIIAYIHVHAGTYDEKTFKGDAVLHPKGYKFASTEDKYTDIDAAINEAMTNAGFKNYDVGTASLYKWYGQVSGTSVDYATAIYGIPFGLEFVMQPYVEVAVEKPGDDIRDNILTEVWRRVIDVVFNTIHRNTQQLDASDSN